jgi:tetratricopeptide (TPR) repeat protein
MNVLIFEEHSAVLATWWSLPKRQRTLIYFDAHIDLQQISPKRLRQLQECTTAQQVADLNKPHHLSPDRGSSYSLEDFLYPAHRLGLIERIIWVAPPHVHTSYTPAVFERLQQMDGVEFEELLSFRRVPQGWIEGCLLGVDLTICDYRQLSQMVLPADILLDIDIDYFIALPADAPWVGPREIYTALAALPLTPEFVTISRSVASGFTPLRYRYFADYLAALYEGREADSSHFDRLFELDALHRAGSRVAAASGCRAELKMYPNCPATQYLLSLTSSNIPEAHDSQHRATALCPAYEASVLRAACEFPARGLPLDLSALRALESDFAARRRGAVEDACTYIALGLLNCHLGRLEAARACYQQATLHFEVHPELAYALGNALIQSQRPNEALAFLEVALADDKTAAGAHMLLGRIFASAKDWVKAQAHLEAASELAPAWTHLLDLRAALHSIAGQHQEAALLGQQCNLRRRQASELAERIRAS